MTPKYQAIANDLESKIRSGHYEPGQALPGQRELSTSYGVTLMTLRQALRLLEDQGLVNQHAGRGTFVSGPKAGYGMAALRSLSDELRAQGHTVGTELLGRTRRAAPRWVAEQLGTAHTVRIERVRGIDGTPAIHQVSWLPEQLDPDVDLTTVSLYDALKHHGIHVHKAQERLTPALLPARLAAKLGKPENVPVFLSDRVTFDQNSTPVVVDRATILGDLIEIRTEREAASYTTLPAWRGSPTVR